MKITKKDIGIHCRKLREKQNKSMNHFKQFGLAHREIKAIEQGSTNYTIDKLLTYYNSLT